MDKLSYKTIDNIPRFMAELWKLFPSFIAKRHTSGELENLLFKPLLLDSKEMCNVIKNGFIKTKNSLGAGAVGEVGEMVINENNGNKTILGVTVSVKPEDDDNDYPGFEPFYMPLIIKKSQQAEFLEVTETKIKNITMIGVTDPFSEAVFGSFASHIYDLGFTPLPMKMFGFYACQKGKAYNFRSISEKSNIPFSDLLARDKKYLDIITPDDIVNFLIQYIYGMFVLKYYYGFVDYDTHLDNIMVTFTKPTYLSRVFKSEIPPYFYHSKNLGNIEYMVYEYPSNSIIPTYIVTKNIGLTKLIDYGGCAVHFNNSVNYSSYNLALYSINILQFYIDGDKSYMKSVNNKSYANTVDIYYSLINLYYTLKYGLDDIINLRTNLDEAAYNKIISNFIEKQRPTPKQSSLLNSLMPFFNIVFPGGIESYLYKNNINIDDDDKITGIFGSRDVGSSDKSFDKPSYFLDLIIKYLTSINHVKKTKVLGNGNTLHTAKVLWLEGNDVPPINSENSIYFSLTNTVDGDNLNEYIEHNANYYESCDLKLNNKILKSFDSCKNAKTELEEFNPNNVNKKSIIKYVMKKNNVKISELKNYESYHYKNLFSIYDLYIYPAQLKMSDMKYSINQLWFDFNKVKPDKIGKYIELIVLYVLKVKQPVNMTIDIGNNLWKSAHKNLGNFSSGFSVNGNFFITEKLLDDYKLHPNIKPFSIEKPIGFFYDENNIKNSGTLAPIPTKYRHRYAAIYTVKERDHSGQIKSKIYFDRYSDFIDKHYTIEVPEKISVYEYGKWSKPREIKSKIISVNNGKSYGGKPDTDIFYSQAFVSGPILVWNGVLEFTEQVMSTSEFVLDDNKYTRGVNQCFLPDKCKTDNRSYKVKDIREIASKCGIDIYKRRNDLKTRNQLCDEIKNKAKQVRSEQTKGIPYKTYSDSETSSKYFSSEGEYSFPYGQRLSNLFVNQTIMAQDKEGNIVFFLLEGRGYGAPGLPRDKLAELVSKFDIMYAVSLDGGFSTNAVIKYDNNYKWLLNDPEKRELGLSLSFGFN